MTEPGLDWIGLAVAMGCALGSGLITIRAFLRIVRSGVLWPFALYCAVLGGVALVMG